MKICVQIFISLALALPANSYAASEAMETEFYSDRPEISEIQAARGGLDAADKRVLRGLINFVIELRVFYPESTFYILARDGEPIFDLWKLLFPQDFQKNRVKLVNISRVSLQHKSMRDYLKSTGLIEDAKRGKHLVAVDSGYEGSIVDAINVILQDEGAGKLFAHLMSSAHNEIPSSRVSTRPFLAAAKRKEVEDGDYVSEAAELAVEELEKIAHYTQTANAYERTGSGAWEAVSATNTPEGHIEALKYMAGLKQFAIENAQREQVAQTTELFTRLLEMARAERPLNRAAVEGLTADLEKAGLEDVYGDLREAMGKETIALFNPARLVELWKFVPQKFYALSDIDDEEIMSALQEREEEVAELAATQRDRSGDFWVVDIIRLYLNALSSEEAAAREQIHSEFMEAMPRFTRKLDGKTSSIGKKIGEGIRSDVYELGRGYVIKVAYESEDMAAIEGEALVYDFLKKNADKYPLRLLDILERGPRGMFLIKPRVEKDTIGKYILKGGNPLSAAQLKSLEQVYEVSRRLAEDTGVSLDIKSDNLVWTPQGWAILDLGARTMSHPYFFTLERQSFSEYLKIWNSDSGERSGVMDVEDYIRQSQRACEEAVVTGYRKLKADN